MNSNIKSFASVLIILVFTLMGIASTEEEDEIEKDIVNTTPDFELSASKLSSDYQDNEIAADEKYKHKIILVTGYIDDIGKDITDSIYVTLSDGKEYSFSGVQCFFSDSQTSAAAKLKKGQKVSIKGKCDGLMMNVLLRGCTLQ